MLKKSTFVFLVFVCTGIKSYYILVQSSHRQKTTGSGMSKMPEQNMVLQCYRTENLVLIKKSAGAAKR